MPREKESRIVRTTADLDMSEGEVDRLSVTLDGVLLKHCTASMYCVFSDQLRLLHSRRTGGFLQRKAAVLSMSFEAR